MSYERTAEHREKMSQALKGKRHSWRSASSRPEVAARIRAWWTPERREEHRQKLLARNPQARYHGLSAREAARIVAAKGACEACGKKGRLDIHHKDRDKRNQRPENLAVLCHLCHMQEHARAGETGWDSYHRKRKNPRSSKT